jgi:hypothetical protein
MSVTVPLTIFNLESILETVISTRTWGGLLDVLIRGRSTASTLNSSALQALILVRKSLDSRSRSGRFARSLIPRPRADLGDAHTALLVVLLVEANRARSLGSRSWAAICVQSSKGISGIGVDTLDHDMQKIDLLLLQCLLLPLSGVNHICVYQSPRMRIKTTPTRRMPSVKVNVHKGQRTIDESPSLADPLLLDSLESSLNVLDLARLATSSRAWKAAYERILASPDALVAAILACHDEAMEACRDLPTDNVALSFLGLDSMGLDSMDLQLRRDAALLDAVALGMPPDIFMRLLQAPIGADINAFGGMILVVACLSGNREAVETLLEQGLHTGETLFYAMNETVLTCYYPGIHVIAETRRREMFPGNCQRQVRILELLVEYDNDPSFEEAMDTAVMQNDVDLVMTLNQIWEAPLEEHHMSLACRLERTEVARFLAAESKQHFHAVLHRAYLDSREGRPEMLDFMMENIVRDFPDD